MITSIRGPTHTGKYYEDQYFLIFEVSFTKISDLRLIPISIVDWPRVFNCTIAYFHESLYHLELLKATSTEHGKEKRDDNEVARRCSYPYSELKVRGFMSESKERN